MRKVVVSCLLLGVLLVVALLVRPRSAEQPKLSASVAFDVVPETVQIAPTDPSSLDEGRRLYQVYCWFCHGTEGRGDGRLSAFFDVKPRDFTLAEYKIRSTPQSALPTDRDLFLTISRGIPGTHMPSWHALSEKQRWELVAFIKSFCERFRTSGAPQPIEVIDPLKAESKQHDHEVLARGRQVYEQVKCWLCHGKEGRGDGPITTALVRHWEMPFSARNLRDGASFKGGSTIEDIYRTITTGFNGTRMGSHEDLLTAQDRWYVAHYVASLADRRLSRDTPLDTGVSWQRGQWLFFGKGRCILCHNVENKGTESYRGPDLSQIGLVAATRRKGLSAVEYIYESITKPREFLVPDYPESMPKINQESIFLDADEVRSLVVYLSSQGEGAQADRSQLASLPESTSPDSAENVLPQLAGDPENGWRIYNSEKANCFKCHTLHGHGQKLAPVLTNLSAFQSQRQVRESVLEPNKIITSSFRQHTVLTVEGRVITGVVVKKDSLEVQLVDANGKVHSIPRELIEEMVLQKASNMPTDITKQLTEQERADLIAFLLDQQPALQAIYPLPPHQPFVDPYARPKNGPPLANVIHKVGRGWLARWLKDPRGHDPNTFMPNLELADDEIEAIVAYLTTIAEPDFPDYQWESYLAKPLDDLKDDEFDALDAQISDGKRLWSESRCSICHRVGERGGVVGHAPALTNAAAKLRRDWVYYWLQDPRYYFPSTQMPHFRFTPQQRKSLLAYILRGDDFGGMDVEVAPDEQQKGKHPPAELVRRGREVIARTRCTVCHEIPGVKDTLPSSLDWPEPRNDFEVLVRDARCLSCHTLYGRGGSFAPDLTTLGSRLKSQWIVKFLVAPDIIRPMLKQMPKLNLSEVQAQIVAAYAKQNLTDPDIDPDFLADYQVTAEDVKRGRKIYDSKGCIACHQIGLTGGALGPELTTVGDRLEPGYIYAYISDPQRFRPDAVEPNYGFTHPEALQLTKFLLSLSEERIGDVPRPADDKGVSK